MESPKRISLATISTCLMISFCLHAAGKHVDPAPHESKEEKKSYPTKKTTVTPESIRHANSALQEALLEGSVEKTQKALDDGADVATHGKDLLDRAYLISGQKGLQIQKLLLETGKIHQSILNYQFAYHVWAGSPLTIVEPLLRHKANPNTRSEPLTHSPLKTAQIRGNTALEKLLLQYKATL